ncbi:MAG TPA: glycoside hydrolase [Vicinamibacteria bacterium]
MLIRRPAAVLVLSIAATALAPAARAESYDPGLFRELRWRMIGPHRGGRTKAAAGIPDQPNVFYVGAVNGGVWKTDDYGRTWRPIFDDQPTGSIGAIAIAPSSPDVIYVGSGEGLQRPDLSTGDGIYKSTDGGRTWRHLGLRQGRQIPQIAVDPRDPNRLFVAVLGSPYGPGPERGLFRSSDGGETFQKVLYRDEDTGAVDVVLDPKDPGTVYAVLWESRQAPWENGVFNGPGSGLYKSADGGATWRPLTKGLPTFPEDGLGRIGITVAPSEPRRLYATVEAKRNGGLYRSDDAGESWARVNADPRVTERGSDFAEVKVHPADPDTVFTASVVTWKSTDGGHTFTAFRGAPGGDDYHRIWINPRQPDVMLIASDQGAIVTVNGGRSWSSWYNQPTAQLYHVSTDNAFPYRVCGGQQESGSVCIASRGDDGETTFRDWHPVAVEEYGYVAPDPLDPDVVYGGRLTRYDRRTGQAQNVTPRALRTPSFRVLRTAPVLFAPTDPHTLYFASNTLWKTSDGGQTWAEISPDLTRATWEAPANVGKYRGTEAARPTRRGVIYTVAPSPVDGQRIWAGTDDGLIHLTTDGGRTWTDVTPPALRDRPWSKVSLIDASRFDAGTAYAAINTFRLDDLRPHVYRTRDGGRSWTEITAGIPEGGIVNTVREDPVRRGLLFAGTEQAVYVSFDDGESWRPLRLNMPATSIRDLVVKDDDLVVGTHGRGFWILDDISPLRQMAPPTLQEAAFLFSPPEAWRFRWNKNTDTPLPPDEPAGENPPDGATLHYFLKEAAPGPVSLEIVDAGGTVVRRYRSDDPPEPPVEGRNIPDYWIRPPQPLSAAPGLHRFVWDLHYPPPAVLERSYPIAAIYRNTPAEPRGPWALPGAYTVRLTAGGRTLTRPLRLKMDPRVKASPDDLHAQLDRSQEIAGDLARSVEALERVKKERGRTPEGPKATELARMEASLKSLNGRLATVYGILQEADAAPTRAALQSARELRQELDSAVAAAGPP